MGAATGRNFRMTIIRRITAACLAALPWSTARHAQAAEPPLVIAKSGYLFAGGKIDTSITGSPMVGHMYAEFQIPQKLLHPYPIVMIHGGSQTGTNFTGTPDGREGWAQYFVRRGYAVYVVDQVARETAAATELQRGMAECAAEHAKLATVLREKFPDQDWSAFAPAPQPAKK